MAELHGGDKLAAALEEIARNLATATELRVGFLENATYPDGKQVAFVAAMNEFGHGIGSNPGAGKPDTRQRVPPRPFFRNMIADKSSGWPDAIELNLKARNYHAREALETVGEGIAGQLRQSIQDFDSVPLAQATIDRKGFDKQLIDTSVMINSVDFDVK